MPSPGTGLPACTAACSSLRQCLAGHTVPRLSVDHAVLQCCAGRCVRQGHRCWHLIFWAGSIRLTACAPGGRAPVPHSAPCRGAPPPTAGSAQPPQSVACNLLACESRAVQRLQPSMAFGARTQSTKPLGSRGRERDPGPADPWDRASVLARAAPPSETCAPIGTRAIAHLCDIKSCPRAASTSRSSARSARPKKSVGARSPGDGVRSMPSST